jgi:DNA-binding MarR family transcriptional regulator
MVKLLHEVIDCKQRMEVAMSTDNDALAEQRERVMNGFINFAFAQNELGREFARGVHLHTTDSSAILAIISADERGKPLTPVRLADLIGLTTGATSVLLNRLEDAGHVTRKRGHADRRMVTLHSTPSVHETADAFYQPLSDRFDVMMKDYSPEELHLVEKFVVGMKATMDAYMEERGDEPADA